MHAKKNQTGHERNLTHQSGFWYAALIQGTFNLIEPVWWLFVFPDWESTCVCDSTMAAGQAIKWSNYIQ